MNRPVGSKAEIFERLRGARHKLAALGVANIGLFGSFVTGRQTSTGDVDILVELAPDQHSFDNFMELSIFLESLLGRRVELVTPEALSPYIGPHILRQAERISVYA
jgi:hypothetical protein